MWQRPKLIFFNNATKKILDLFIPINQICFPPYFIWHIRQWKTPFRPGIILAEDGLAESYPVIIKILP